MKNNILIVDYKVGNYQSVANALSVLGYDYVLSSNRKEIEEAQCYILPGVGAFSEAMNNLKKLDLVEPLKEEVLAKKKPILGICLGMQVLADSSEENGFHKGLGFIKGRVVKIEAWENLRIPHVGWNNVAAINKDPLFQI